MRNYGIYRAAESVWADPFTTLKGVKVHVEHGTYRFYKNTFSEPVAVYPVSHFYIVDLDG